MVLKETLKKVVLLQQKALKDTGLERELLKKIDLKHPIVYVLSGIRRSGKSTLLKQLIKKVKTSYYFNFEDSRIADFTVKDFEKLDEIFKEEFGETDYYFFDEIQNVAGWETFVRQKQDEGKKIIVTGSNASLLSRELGTKLTGRHITYEVFPFNYNEMLKLLKIKTAQNTLIEYLKKGGFPEYLKYEKIELLQELLNDIIARDIIIRHKLKDAKTIKELAVFLLSNIGKEFSYNKLREYFKVGSTNTITAYISFLEDSYMFFTMPKFDYSYKKQLINPKKIYAIDSGFIRANTASFSLDDGRILENVVFLQLRRKYKEIFYFKEKKECDFVVKDKGKVIKAVQACYKLTEDNKEREIEGLLEAMKKFKLKKGTIITIDQKDKIGNIEVIPLLDWLKRK